MLAGACLGDHISNSRGACAHMDLVSATAPNSTMHQHQKPRLQLEWLDEQLQLNFYHGNESLALQTPPWRPLAGFR